MSVGAYNFNYSVLSDSEFEELCLDILNAKTKYNSSQALIQVCGLKLWLIAAPDLQGVLP